MNQVERDDLIHAITQVQAFYNKELDALQMKLWLRALSDHPAANVKTALADYTARGKYAPKPVDILEVMDARVAQEARALPPPETSGRTAPPEVAAAWAYVIKLWGMGDIGKAGSDALAPEEIDRRLALCNRQAFGSNNPEAIPPDAWLEEVWGCSREDAIQRAAT